MLYALYKVGLYIRTDFIQLTLAIVKGPVTITNCIALITDNHITQLV